jgi:SAM-dependent methyltransferase
MRRQMDSPDELHAFWRQASPEGNDPREYIQATERSQALLTQVDVPKDARILEVGCNVGRNLAVLWDAGYTNIEGIEINPHAVDLLRETFPQLSGCAIHLGPAEEVLPKLSRYYLIFTMAVLEHIHPDKSIVFDRMAELADHILAIEPSNHGSHRQYPHDVPVIFQRRGFVLERSVRMRELIGDEAMRNYTAWTFLWK